MSLSKLTRRLEAVLLHLRMNESCLRITLITLWFRIRREESASAGMTGVGRDAPAAGVA